MGLDNGIILNASPDKYDVNKLIKLDKTYDGLKTEICYWRKC